MKKYELTALYHQLYRDTSDNNTREYRDTSDNIREYRDTSDNTREYRDTSDNNTREYRDTSDNIREYRDTSDNTSDDISDDNTVNHLGLLEKYTTPYELNTIELYPSYSWNEYEL